MKENWFQMRPFLPEWTIFSIDHKGSLSTGSEKWQGWGRGAILNYSLIYAKEVGKISAIVFSLSLTEFPILFNILVKEPAPVIQGGCFPARTLTSESFAS